MEMDRKFYPRELEGLVLGHESRFKKPKVVPGGIFGQTILPARQTGFLMVSDPENRDRRCAVELPGKREFVVADGEDLITAKRAIEAVEAARELAGVGSVVKFRAVPRLRDGRSYNDYYFVETVSPPDLGEEESEAPAEEAPAEEAPAE